jgi:hypothetical protein
VVGVSVAVELGDVRGGQVVGVAEHGVGEGAEGGREAEVLGAFAAERDDELGDVGADVLDVCNAPESTWNIWPAVTMKVENRLPSSSTETSAVPDTQ